MEHVAKKRCVVYCRKSVEDAETQSFNSIDAQREAGENYIASQKTNGWICVPTKYDDYGYSGGDTKRPALQQLLKDCEAGLVDIVVVYKIDRLSRSIFDFSELAKFFDEHGIQFVAVTQEINTATSSGRMMLNILMTFAQYEREIISERTRDKLFMSRSKGMYVGGITVLGYKVVDKKLVIVPEEAEIIRFIFNRYIEIQSPLVVARELNAKGITTKQGKKWNRLKINNVLNNYTYNGKVFYRNSVVYEGEHDAIIEDDIWNRAKEVQKANVVDINKRMRIDIPLRNMVTCGHCNKPMMPHYTKKKQIRYYYYVCEDYKNEVDSTCQVQKIPSELLEDFVKEHIERILKSKDVMYLLEENTGFPASVLLEIFDEHFWEHTTRAEFTRLVHLLFNKITVYPDHVDFDIKYGGLKSIEKDYKKNEN